MWFWKIINVEAQKFFFKVFSILNQKQSEMDIFILFEDFFSRTERNFFGGEKSNKMQRKSYVTHVVIFLNENRSASCLWREFNRELAIKDFQNSTYY